MGEALLQRAEQGAPTVTSSHLPPTISHRPGLPPYPHAVPTPSQEGLTPLQAACRRKRPELVSLLAACPCVSLSAHARDGPFAEPGRPARLTAYMLACDARDRGAVEALVRSGRFSADGYALEESPAAAGSGEGEAADPEAPPPPGAPGRLCTVRRMWGALRPSSPGRSALAPRCVAPPARRRLR